MPAPSPPTPPIVRVLARARALYDLGRWEDARAAYHEALALAPGSEVALGQLSNVHFHLGDRKQALAYAEQMVAAAPQSEWAHRVLSTALLSRGRARQAEAAALEAVRLAPDEPLAYDALARAHVGRRRLEDARVAAERRRALAPHDADSHALLAVVARQRQRAAEAEAHARAALAVDPEHQQATELLGWAQLAQGRVGEAVDTSLAAARRAPSRETSAQFVQAATALPHPTAYGLSLGGPAAVLGATGLAAWLTPAAHFSDVVRAVFCGGIAAWVAAMVYHVRRHRARLRPEVRQTLEAATMSAGQTALVLFVVLGWFAALLGAFLTTLVFTLGGPGARPHTALGWAAYAGLLLAVGWATRAGWRQRRRLNER